jgi:histidyl-tRNA synthetase
MSIKVPTPKGFRDIEPSSAKKRREIIGKIADTLEEFGFVPLETPIIEFAETLKGKYGEEADRLIYEFTDRGGRKIALRYDLTVPLARFVANNLGLIQNKSFRRYQIGEVFRGENPQKGRFRQFTQFDMDSVGSNDLKEDATIIAAALKAAKAVGLKNPVMCVNDRVNFNDISPDAIRAIDKLDKIGDAGVISELETLGIKNAKEMLNKIKNQQPTENLKTIFNYLKELGVSENEIKFQPTLARGLDYYTGMIIELRDESAYGNLSLGGGGRYDNLIGMFAKKDIPAVGFSFGIDRLVEALE